MNDRLYRSVDDRVLAGVCGGLAVRLAIDPSLVRIGYAVARPRDGDLPAPRPLRDHGRGRPRGADGLRRVGRSPTPPGPDAVPGWAAAVAARAAGRDPGAAWATQPAAGSTPPSAADAAARR